MQFCHREPPDVLLPLPQTVSQVKFFPPQAADCQVVNHSNIKNTTSSENGTRSRVVALPNLSMFLGLWY